MSDIAVRLDKLLAAFEAKGCNIASSLQPGLSHAELSARTQWFPANLPPELFELYAWRNGQANDPWNEEFPFWFRDRGFASVEIAKFEYESMMATYGVDCDPEVDGIDLATAFPFAAFNGGWYVLPCSGQSLDTVHEKPVISVLQGINIHFYSLQSMLDICIECVAHPRYEVDEADLPEKVEREIWRHHNPGIFD